MPRRGPKSGNFPKIVERLDHRGAHHIGAVSFGIGDRRAQLIVIGAPGGWIGFVHHRAVTQGLRLDRLDAARTIRVMRAATLRRVAVIRDGMAAPPTTMRDGINLRTAMAGTAITIYSSAGPGAVRPRRDAAAETTLPNPTPSRSSARPGGGWRSSRCPSRTPRTGR